MEECIQMSIVGLTGVAVFSVDNLRRVVAGADPGVLLVPGPHVLLDDLPALVAAEDRELAAAAAHWVVLTRRFG